MFNVPPVRDANRNIQIRQLKEVNAIEPVAPFPHIEQTGHGSDEPDRPDAVDERLRGGNKRRRQERDEEQNGAQQRLPEASRSGASSSDDDDHYLDEYV